MRLTAITLFVLSAAVFAGVAKADDPANRSPELQVLDRFAGTWNVTFVNKPVGGEKVTSDLVLTRAWSRGGTFIRCEDANNLENLELPEFQMLLTCDPDSKNYPTVTMNGASRGELTGTWDEKTQTMALTAPFLDGNKFASTHRFIGKSRAEASETVKNPAAEFLAELSWDQTRRKDAAKVAVASEVLADDAERMKDGDPKPPASPDLDALNRKQRNPIAPELLAAADAIRRLNEYLIICGGALVLAFFPTLTILALASRAFAFYYMLQCIISITVSKSGGQKLFFGVIAAVLAFITLFAVPAGYSYMQKHDEKRKGQARLFPACHTSAIPG